MVAQAEIADRTVDRGQAYIYSWPFFIFLVLLWNATEVGSEIAFRDASFTSWTRLCIGGRRSGIRSRVDGCNGPRSDKEPG